ncbi:MAG TPA: hypothetical protein VNQ14_04335 [Woeseiaceae bacterium]|nr:hypothetical protein [Woeseiaceae bacterium]
MKHNDHWHFDRKSLQETIVVVIVGALAIGVFLGVIHVMSPGSASEGESAPQAAEAAPPAVEDAPEPAPPG